VKVLDPGHLYSLAQLDDVDGAAPSVMLRFVKRVGPAYPGNDSPGYAGTTMQDVLRALIDRALYVDRQDPSPENAEAVEHMRSALWAFEERTARKRGQFVTTRPEHTPVETLPVCARCGHVVCEGRC
jgi:hypothetical protein